MHLGREASWTRMLSSMHQGRGRTTLGYEEGAQWQPMAWELESAAFVQAVSSLMGHRLGAPDA